MIDIIKVHSKSQIADVAHLAREIWQEHYVPIIKQKQVDYMLDKYQSEPAIVDQLANAYQYYIVSRDIKNIGYIAVIPNEKMASLMISKIYVKKSERGQGLGQMMLEFVENLCQQCCIKTIWLTVNKNNRRSIAWYLRMGFTNAGPTLQDIGEGFVMDDFRMEKTINQQARVNS